MKCGHVLSMDEHKKPKSDLHQIILTLLQEKRELLVKLQEERKQTSELREENERLTDKLKEKENVCSIEGEPTSLSSSVQGSLESFQDESLDRVKLESAILKDKLSTLEENLRECREKLASVENQKFVLQGEVMRLAQALSKTGPNMELELTREQLRIYEHDYRQEKTERDVAEKKASNLHLKVHDYEELVSTLTTQVELYKRAFEREKEEKEELVRERVSNNSHSSNTLGSYGFSEELAMGSGMSPSKSPVLPSSQLQLVHPLSESKITPREELKRKQELERMGILTRDSKPSGVLYGGDVKIDQYANF